MITDRALKAGAVAGCVTVVLTVAAVAAEPQSDPTFGADGVVVLPPDTYPTERGVRALTQDAQGRLVAVGSTSFEFAALRLGPDGSPDPSFGQDPVRPGLVRVNVGGGDGLAEALALQSDGKLIAAGFNYLPPPARTGKLALVRLDEDGSVDDSFGKRGRAIFHVAGFRRSAARGVSVQADGRIVVAGRSSRGRGRGETMGFVLRYREDGRIDRTFGNGGLVRFDPHSRARTAIEDVVVLASGKLLVAGTFRGRFLLSRLRSDGSFDPSFGGGDGRVVRELDRRERCSCGYAASIAVQPDGGIVLLADLSYGSSFFVLARYLPNGRLDRSFAIGGVTPRFNGFSGAFDVVLDESGRIIVAGNLQEDSARFTVFRYLANGQLDPSFDGDGVLVRPIGDSSLATAAVIQSDGRLVTAGSGEVEGDIAFVLMRFLAGA